MKAATLRAVANPEIERLSGRKRLAGITWRSRGLIALCGFSGVFCIRSFRRNDTKDGGWGNIRLDVVQTCLQADRMYIEHARTSEIKKKCGQVRD
ncbi:hypothetical protein EVAR_81005_1 [Eumeta japonica]|uniref:Uncharacterized protein n=1 Tax=Eumeta variegata TaxID=151549 RepID=A0A4C1T5M5_EUMVA|nr:hypothetical protein EVAR_81005_1 [Eumeta japonica]